MVLPLDEGPDIPTIRVFGVISCGLLPILIRSFLFENGLSGAMVSKCECGMRLNLEVCAGPGLSYRKLKSGGYVRVTAANSSNCLRGDCGVQEGVKYKIEL